MKNIKKYISILLVALIVQSCSSVKIDSDWERDTLQGEVLSIKKVTYRAEEKFGEIVKGERKTDAEGTKDDVLIKYDKKGNRIEERHIYSKFYSLIDSCKYDGKGNVIELSSYLYSYFNYKLISKSIFEYDESGNMIVENLYESGVLDFRLKYSYNLKGYKIKESGYKEDGSLSWERVSVNDKNGNEIEMNVYNSDKELLMREIKKFDENGNRIEQRKTGERTEWNTYKYDERGNQTEENRKGSDGRVFQRITDKYDEEGNLLENKHYNANDVVVYNIYFKYDESGNIIEKYSYKSDGNLDYKFTYDYEFDKQGNWVRMTEFKSDIAKIVTEREIGYYE